MIYRIFLFLALVVLPLQASPNFEQMKRAIQDNPELIDTPQAQMLMAEKGLTPAEVKLMVGDTNKPNGIKQEITLDNNISKSFDTNTTFEENNETSLEEMNETIDIVEIVTKKANPFLYKTNEEIEEELVAKQQRLIVNEKLSRYSMNFFTNSNQIDTASLPTPDNYILSTGDEISIHVYGDRNKDYSLEIKNNGTVDLEYIGPVKIGGMKFIEAKKHLQKKLKSHYKMSSFNINIDKYSSIQVTLVGEVKHPGIYNLSSFSTVKDLLTEAKGIQNNASIRDIIVKRNSKTIARIDFYDLLFKAKELSTVLLKHGDIIIIKKAKKLVSIDGYVNNTSIFELTKEESLKELIDYAGGMKAEAYKLNIKVDRYSDNSKLETFNIDYKNANKFKMEDGDKVYLYSLDFSVDSSINIYGNIIKPGNYRLDENQTLNSVFKGLVVNGKKSFFLPQTYFNYGVIKRYSENLEYETKTFNLVKVLDGSEIVELKAQDEVYIFSQTDIYSNSYVTTIGEILVNPGKLQYFPGMTIQDAVNASKVDGVIDDLVRVTSIDTPNRMPKTNFYSLKDAGNTKLGAYDEIEVFDFYEKSDLEPVSIKGEVLNPISVFYEKDMNLSDLIEVSGGLTRKAYKNKIEIVRYYLGENNSREKEIFNLDISKTDVKNVKINPYDEVTIFTIPRWSEKKVIEVKGEVKFPGTYTIDNGEKLSSVLKRAGGFTKDSFVEGTVFTRESIRQNQVEQYNRSLSRVKRELAIYGAMPANAGKSGGLAQASNTLNEVMLEAQKYQPIGRISVKITDKIEELENSHFNLVLQDKDTVTIPSKMDTVTVFGEVFNPTSFVYDSSKDSFEYIELASGFSRAADTARVYVIHADGTSEPISGGLFGFNSVDINKGDTIVVPIYMKEYDTIGLWDSVSKILSSFALTAAAVNSLGIFQ